MSEPVKDSFDRFCRNNASLQDLEFLSEDLEAEDAEQRMKPLLLELWKNRVPDPQATEAESRALADLILAKTGYKEHREPARVSFLRSSWIRYAAAVLLFVGTATAILISTPQSSENTHNIAVVTPEILPGTNKAVLTIDDKAIDLSSEKSGITVGEEIAYSDGEKLSDAGKLMTLSTPNGGQYQLVLPDGTKAWLNAASSISFPSVFHEGRRRVKVTGEVYLEVVQDKSKPFYVDVNGRSGIEVLGTSFNINSYDNEAEIRTTLIDGSVRVVAGTSVDSKSTIAGASSKLSYVVLKPGQQAVQAIASSVESKSAGIVVKSDADIAQTLAWKNGLFSFNNADLRSAMKQLERWYDIKVVYEGEVPNIEVRGKLNREVKLSSVLEWFNSLGIKTRLEGRTLVVL